MSTEYDRYLREHISNVQKGLQWIQTNLPELVNPFCTDDGSLCGKNLNAQFSAHDNSKFSAEEYDAYDRYFYGGNRSTKVVNDFNYAWLHHIHNNPHHWQYWVLIDGDGTIYLDMPYNYIIEMICDWWAFSWAKDNLFEIFEWYDKNKKKILLSTKTRNIVEDILGELKTKLDENIKNAITEVNHEDI